MDKTKTGYLYDDKIVLGVRGMAGAGKDTVSLLVSTMLNHKLKGLDNPKLKFDNMVKFILSTPNFLEMGAIDFLDHTKNFTFARGLKETLVQMFGIPYDDLNDSVSKETKYINLKDFSYRDINALDEYQKSRIFREYEAFDMFRDGVHAKPFSPRPITSDVWMSLRSFMVYFGTYISQTFFGAHVWLNNVIHQERETPKKRFVWVYSDCRFPHEISHVINKGGFIIKVIRDINIKESVSIAETSLHDNEQVDYIINNKGSMEDLYEPIMNIVNDLIKKNGKR